MLSKVIGIISYLPDTEPSRTNRINKLKKLIKKCNELFKLPIIIIAQNWNENEITVTKNVTVINFCKLGITTARTILRNKFLNSSYDYLIMLDDDCELSGTKEGAQAYLNMIESHPEGYGCFRAHYLNLFAISKSLYKKVNIPNINREAEEGFEDKAFVEGVLGKNYSDIKYNFIDSEDLTYTVLISSIKDPDSTWYRGQNIKEMDRKTTSFIKSISYKKLKEITPFNGWKW